MSEISDMKQDEQGNWHKAKALTEFSLRIEKASYDKATNERRWRAVASDTDEDSRSDNMSLELFNDFISRITANELVPEDFRSDFWSGGMPYLSVSHYSDLDGAGVPGMIDSVYVDGTYLKSKGRFNDNDLGRKCFESVCASLYGETDTDKVRISIGFLDWGHKHKSNGYLFERSDIDEICPQCLKELLSGEGEGLIFLRGQLVHLALTRVPANKRTSMEVEKMADIKTRKDDAESIVGEELAAELEEKSKMVGKSMALVTRSEDEEETKDTVKCPNCGKQVTPTSDGKCPECGKSIAKPDDDMEEKSEVVVNTVEPTPAPDIAEIVRSVILETIRLSEPVQETPLDSAFAEFRRSFDNVMKSDAGEETKLQSIQEPFNVLGKSIVEIIKSSVKVEKSEQVTETSDLSAVIAKAITDAMNPFAQKLDLLSTQLSQTSQDSRIPVRRSITPSMVMQSEAAVQTPKSNTPKLRAIIDKTVR